ncbi:hypothetical protein [Lactococcus kimchii]|uniref:hypothetical protein n=1 Tax=Lactococcus sp. S-13 TaxID=2507158 RepID=UPI00102354B0|nr:hypothetical protein [Lactococcus sp. S-13]RZI49642.1 hypothetical protein EQJ87_09510 [Lactococcus sp. S-13]
MKSDIYIKSNSKINSLLTMILSISGLLIGAYFYLYVKGGDIELGNYTSNRSWGGLVFIVCLLGFILTILSLMSKKGENILYLESTGMTYLPESKHKKFYSWKEVENIKLNGNQIIIPWTNFKVGSGSITIKTKEHGAILINSGELKIPLSQLYDELMERWKTANE